MKASAFFLFVFFSVAAYSQNTINNYKYVLVPDKFSLSKEPNQYGLNVLTKLLLESKGFTAFVGNEELPADLAANRCNALMADVTEKNSLFVTKLTLVLKDCQGNIIFKSKEGKSREKEYQPANEEALRDAFSSLEAEPYKYTGPAANQPQPVTAPPSTSTQPQTQPQTHTPAPAPTTPSVNENTGVLYAQATPNGYQLIDTTPKKVLSLLKTSMQDYFIAVDGGNTGVVFKKNEEWIYEYYKDNKLISHKLQIKF